MRLKTLHWKIIFPSVKHGEARHRILSSRACESLYNFKTKLWAEGPDYFRAFYEAVETVETVERNSKGKGISKDNTQKRGSQQVMNDKS